MLNAAFLSADLGLTPSSREEHAAYIAGLHGSSSGSAQPLSQNGPLPSSRSDPSLPFKGNGRAHVTPVAHAATPLLQAKRQAQAV
jgi:hypothetical protein